jgi:hypothetical protein
VLCIPKVSHFVWNRRRNPVIVILLAVLFWISIYVSANAGSNAFMYFDF